MESRALLLSIIIIMYSTVAVGVYLVTDYYMDPKFPKIFGQICGKTIQDDCLWINSHLNTFGLADYGPNRDCITTLDAGDHPGSMYKLKWKRFKIESGDCSNDYLELYDSSMDIRNSSTNLIGRFCGRSYPNISGYPTQQYLTLKWHTNGAREDKGFRILATRNLPFPCLDHYFHCKAENRCIDGRLKCDGVEQCDDGEDESSCSGWEKFIGGFLALGTAGIVGVSGSMLFGCIVIGCVTCAVTCCKKPCGNCWKTVCKPCRKSGKVANKEESRKNHAETADEAGKSSERNDIKTPLPHMAAIPVYTVAKTNETAVPDMGIKDSTTTNNKPPSPVSSATRQKKPAPGLQTSDERKAIAVVDI